MHNNKLTKSDKLKIEWAINDMLKTLKSHLDLVEKKIQLCDDDDMMLDLICDREFTEQNIFQYNEIINKIKGETQR